MTADQALERAGDDAGTGGGTALGRYVGVVAGEQPTAARRFRWGAPRIVADVMTRDFRTIGPDASIRAVVEALEDNRGYAVPVVDEVGRVLGVVTTSDVLARVAGGHGHGVGHHAGTRRKRRARTARELMTTPAITTTKSRSVTDIARRAAHERIRSLPVLDHRGALVGMVSRDDLVTIFLREDADIRHDVQVAIRRSSYWAGASADAGSVHVTVTDGVVTLTGGVETVQSARRFVDEARRVVGVVGVNDLIAFKVNGGLLHLGPP